MFYFCKQPCYLTLFTMVNTSEFTQRLHKIMEYHDLSAASFADKIDVGRSSISHLLSGRNKPSLDFVMKIVNAFPDVELYWLLNGKGTFPRSEEKRQVLEPVKNPARTPQPDLFHGGETDTPSPGVPPSISTQGKAKDIRRIVIFYADGTFEAFEN